MRSFESAQSHSRFEGIDVLGAKVSVDHKRQQIGLEEDLRCQSSCRPAVAILIGMDLRKPVVHPRRHDDRIVVAVAGQPLEKLLYLRVYVLRRTVLMGHPVWPARIVWLSLKDAVQQRYLESLTELINRHGRLLVLRYRSRRYAPAHAAANSPIASSAASMPSRLMSENRRSHTASLASTLHLRKAASSPMLGENEAPAHPS